MTAETLTSWYQPNPDRHFVIEQPTDCRRMPAMHIYLVCGLAGCQTRFYLAPEVQLRDLGRMAAADGWDVGVGPEVRCPDHLFGRPMQLMPATVDPSETIDLTSVVKDIAAFEKTLLIDGGDRDQ